MRIVLQRVKSAKVSVAGKTVAEIEKGILLLVGVRREEREESIRYLAEKCANLRIFEDESLKMNLSLSEVDGEALVVSQFTLYGDTKKGRRPSFDKAAPPVYAEQVYNTFVNCLKNRGIRVKTGAFGEKMLVEMENDGPVTFILEA